MKRRTSAHCRLPRFRAGAALRARRAGCWALAIVWGLLAAQRAAAFQDLRQLIQRAQERADPRSPLNEYRLNPITDRDAERWLDRAKEAAERQDWKLAADTLSRVIVDYGDRTVSPDQGRVFLSAAKAAREQLMDWSDEGIAAYRLLYDAEAARLLEQGRSAHDLGALRQVARAYPMTTSAPEAMDLLASRLLDEGSGGEAAEILTELQALPHARVPQGRILSRLAVAYALMLQRDKAASALDRLREVGAGDAGVVPSEWQSRVDAIERFLSAQGGGAAGAAPASRDWPQLLGPSYAGGRMPVTRPAVTPDDIWRQTLPGTERLDLSAVVHLIRTTGRTPVWQCVSDGKALFTSTPEGIEARDLGTFDLLWRSVAKAQPRDPAVTQFRVMTGLNESDNAERLDALSTMTLFHEYRGAVSCAHGLVFCIEQFGTANERFPTKAGVVDPNDAMFMNAQGEPNSLRAFEADTGRAVWTRGRGGPPDDELRFVHFYSTPVACGPHLLAPYQAGGDLNLAVLTPDGKLARRVLLGSGRPGIYPINCVLQPTVHEGTVYVPTGAGLLIALSAHDYSLRWLASYERAMLQRRNEPSENAPWVGATRSYSQPDEWLSTPPVVVAGLVIVAPPDGDRILAFDRQTGEQRWSYPRGRLRYIVGADSRSVILAGDKVLALDAATGAARWTSEAAVPTGRPAYCGNEILVPTVEGLVRLSAETGAETGPLLVSREPMGNLLALDGAVYGVTATSITKYPDVEQSRRAAEEALARNPDDWRAMLRLAWLGTIQRKWEASLDLLDRAEKLLSADRNGDVIGRLAHQRVEILLSMAEEADPADREPILRRALEGARRGDDQIRAGLAMIDLLIERGDRTQALERILSLLAERGDEPITLESQLTARTTIALRERLGRIRQAAGEDAVEIVQSAEHAVATALDEGRFDALVRLADGLRLSEPPAEAGAAADPLAEPAARLDVRMGRIAADGHDPESAAFYWERAAARLPGSAAACEALCSLAVLYAKPDPGVAASPVDAARVLNELAEDHASMPIPAALASIVNGDTVSALAEQLRGALPPGATSARPSLPRILRGTTRLEMVAADEVPTSIGLRDTVSFYDPAAPPDIFADVVPVLKLSQVMGLRTRPDASELAAWMIDLGPIVEDQVSVLRDWDTLNTRHAAMAGRIAVLAAGSRITAVGMLTGRMMWPGIVLDVLEDDLPEPPVVYVDGMVIAAPNATSLVAIPARQDGRPAWERQFPGRPIGSLAVVAGQLGVTDVPGETMTVLDPHSGRVRRQYSLRVPAVRRAREIQVDKALKEIIEVAKGNLTADDLEKVAESDAPQVAMTANVVCRVGQTRVVGRDAATGRPIWTLPMAGLVSAVMKLSDRHFGVCHGRSRLAVVDAATGQIVKDINAKDLEVPPLDAVVEGPPASLPHGGDRLLIFARSTGDPPQYVLASYPLKDGDPSWRQELGPLATISRRMLRASRDYIAVVMYELKPDNQQRLQVQARAWWARSAPVLSSARLFVFDKAGEKRLIESPFPFNLGRRPDDRYFSGLLSDIIVLDERIIAVGPDGYYVLQAAEQQAAVDPTPGRVRSIFPGARQWEETP
ncbi:MAG: hypothetical protein DCC65_03870 [Planctomycetota bacterium]|nr:MAG: hypothetical protein DCC65_03870 [Planctomycetota bacterium]